MSNIKRIDPSPMINEINKQLECFGLNKVEQHIYLQKIINELKNIQEEIVKEFSNESNL